MKTRIIMTEGKKFPDFHHYKGKIQKKGVVFSFRFCCNKGNPHRLFIKQKKKSIPVKSVPDFGMTEIANLIGWIVENFDALSVTKAE